jgi:hypothetical protein
MGKLPHSIKYFLSHCEWWTELPNALLGVEEPEVGDDGGIFGCLPN